MSTRPHALALVQRAPASATIADISDVADRRSWLSWPGRDADSVQRALHEVLRRGDGEVVVEGPGGTGRIFVSGHRIAWVVAGGDGERLTSVLADITGLPLEELRTHYAGAIAARRIPGEALIADGVVDAHDVRAALRLHNGRQLARLLAAPIHHIRFDHRARPYSSTLLFTLDELRRTDDDQPTDPMGAIQTCLRSLMALDGAIAAAVADQESGLTLATAVGAKPFDIEAAVAGHTAIVKAKLRVMDALALKDEGIEDILVTLDTQHHLIRPLSTDSSLFFSVVVDTKGESLALARHRLRQVEATLNL